jgi:tetrahydromethanopterin:alpha-L-glutamate ligase
MRIAVLANANSWYLKDLQRAAEDRYEIVPASFRDLTSTLIEKECGVTSQGLDLATCDAVLVRTMPPGSLEQVVFRMDALARLEARGQIVINPPRAIEAAVDKYLTSARLQAAGLLVPRTIVCQTAEDAMVGFAQLGGDIVLKPLFGAEGRGIARLTDESLALRAFKLLEELKAVLYLQEFVPHEGRDLRVFVLGERTFAIERRNPLDWRTNVSRGAIAVAIQLSDELRELALRAAGAIGAPVAGVDLLLGRDGRWHTLEVNAVPGWKALAHVLQIDMAREVLDFVARQCRQETFHQKGG